MQFCQSCTDQKSCAGKALKNLCGCGCGRISLSKASSGWIEIVRCSLLGSLCMTWYLAEIEAHLVPNGFSEIFLGNFRIIIYYRYKQPQMNITCLSNHFASYKIWTIISVFFLQSSRSALFWPLKSLSNYE